MVAKALQRSVRAAQRAWWKWRAPLTLGVRGMVFDEGGRVLLVRHTYMDGWYFPGGGVARRETLEEAVRRELLEEVGVTLIDAPALAGVYSNFAEGKSDHVVLFRAGAYEMRPRRNFEIAEHGFFDVKAPPEDTSPATLRRLAEHLGEAERTLIW